MQLHTTFRIDQRTVGVWTVLQDLRPGTTMEQAEAMYDKLRNFNQDAEYRLVAIEYRQVRAGKGRVYD